jgi:hypothetical protein
LRKSLLKNTTRLSRSSTQAHKALPDAVSPKMAQMLTRHSDLNLTMNTYTMLGVYDQAMAVEALPPIPKMAGVANGTEAGRKPG